MKLYYASNTCSLAAQIVALEADIELQGEKVDIHQQPHVLADGSPFTAVNPKGYVPALELDDGRLLTEGVAILTFLSDLRPDAALAPRDKSLARYEYLQWMTFIATELHKSYSPWLFHPEVGAMAQDAARQKIGERLPIVEARLVGRDHLVGERFTAVDAYAFTILSWSTYAGVALSGFPKIERYLRAIAARPSVRQARVAHGNLIGQES
ncbi:glutathione binding-like protein [Lysobacter auxotrophicus]|uniref:Glutathione transferase GstA n=1 Tax=Lysobacter auxotrophicus TaxID=2992573 RepID=A0ABM8DHN4_9GAMM|nr:glutathione binding-like protein [Lysobacter auxotrophicus]BDU18113.1 glutathione transferase GstA [Lysobacter auxotrophicus]